MFEMNFLLTFLVDVLEQNAVTGFSVDSLLFLL